MSNLHVQRTPKQRLLRARDVRHALMMPRPLGASQFVTPFFDLSTMPVAEKLALKKKLKTELDHVRSAVENIIADCERRLAQKHSAAEEDQAVILGNDCAGEVVASFHSFCIPEQQPSSTGENHQTTMSKRKIAPEMNTNPKDADNYSNDEIDTIPDKSDAKSVLTGPSKGTTLGTSDAPKVKGEKMDSFKTRECANILRILMIHPAGWVFKEPVDPVKLKIPDYFSIISKPMDLGTVKRKLGRKQYSSTVQFAADVRLTFSNAMRYNPPENEVHVMAKELNNIFNSRWKLLEAEWRNKSTLSSQSVTNTLKKKQLLEKRPNPSSGLRRFIPSAEKLKLKKELSNLPVRKMPPRLLSFLQSKAAEIAAKMKAEAELTRQREAARLALQKMEKTVEIDNSHILKDLENLGCPLPRHFDRTDETVGKFMHELEMHSGVVNPLEQLGLFMKNEDLDEVDEWISSAGNGDVEEGEIDGS
ncbi:hypothetical protein BHE74_00004423 [Ensete ventricosum]|nr:hypothetical protein BHE74_00004423 [Ensete ventricosum]